MFLLQPLERIYIRYVLFPNLFLMIFEVQGVEGGSTNRSWGVLEASWRCLGASWRHLGASWRRLGAVLGASWAVFGASWSRLGGILGRLDRQVGLQGGHGLELIERAVLGGP